MITLAGMVVPCLHPNENVVTELPEPEVGFAGARYCDLCGTDLRNEVRDND